METNSATDSEDRRQAIRYPMALPVDWPEGSGRTCNLSSVGVYFKTQQPLVAGRPVRLTLLLESLHESARHLCGEGRVARVERFHGEFGVAVSFTSIRFGRR